jgi:hypothetical protein
MSDTPETDVAQLGTGSDRPDLKERAEFVAELTKARDMTNALARAVKRVADICKEKMLEAEVANLKLERKCNSWKAAHDNQVKLKRIISDRPDLKERAKLVAKLIEERDHWKAEAERWRALSQENVDEVAFDDQTAPYGEWWEVLK